MMGTVELAVRVISGFVLLAINGLFVMTEFALTRLRQFDESEFQGTSSLRLAWKMTEELEIYLTACQVGITITSILLGVVFEPGVTALILPVTARVGLGPAQTAWVSVVLAVALIQLMHTVWGEQSPTYLGVEEPKRVASFGAPIVYAWTWTSYPLIYVGDHLAKWTLRVFGVELTRSWTQEDEHIDDETELRQRMMDLLARGDLSEERREEVVNTLEMDVRSTRSIMVDREDIRYLSTRNSTEENLAIIEQAHFSRLPLVEDSPDEYVGTVYVPPVVGQIEGLRSGEVGWEDVAVEAMTVPADLSISDLVDRFQAENQELALVLEDGTVVGLVTATDAFEAIMGELRDPFD